MVEQEEERAILTTGLSSINNEVGGSSGCQDSTSDERKGNLVSPPSREMIVRLFQISMENQAILLSLNVKTGLELDQSLWSVHLDFEHFRAIPLFLVDYEEI